MVRHLNKDGLVRRILSRGEVMAAITKVYRQMALEHHPDRGGDPKTMSVINLFVERLRAAVREIAL
jgi:hypothetical protein